MKNIIAPKITERSSTFMNGSAGSPKKDDNFFIIPRGVYVLSAIIDILIFMAFSLNFFKIKHLADFFILYGLYASVCVIYTIIGIYLHELTHKWAYMLLCSKSCCVIIKLLPLFE